MLTSSHRYGRTVNDALLTYHIRCFVYRGVGPSFQVASEITAHIVLVLVHGCNGTAVTTQVIPYMLKVYGYEAYICIAAYPLRFFRDHRSADADEQDCGEALVERSRQTTSFFCSRQNSKWAMPAWICQRSKRVLRCGRASSPPLSKRKAMVVVHVSIPSLFQARSLRRRPVGNSNDNYHAIQGKSLFFNKLMIPFA